MPHPAGKPPGTRLSPAQPGQRPPQAAARSSARALDSSHLTADGSPGLTCGDGSPSVTGEPVLAVDNRLPTIRPLQDVKCRLALPQCAGYPLADRYVPLAAR